MSRCSRRLGALAIAGALVFVSVSASARTGETEADEATRLALNDVLASVDTHHPLVAAEVQAVRAAEGGVIQARGAYDPRFMVTGEVIPQGFYDYSSVDASLTQLTPMLGSEFYAGYRYQRGSLPDYVGELETLDRGELRAGVRVPLWKDRSLDDARAGRTRAEAMLTGAEAGLEQVKLGLWLHAAQAYWEWVAAHEGRLVHEELLKLAQLRAKQIAGKVRSGALAPFAELDNERALLSRQAKLVMATRKLEKAQLKLSLFWRDPSGTPAIAQDRVPPPLDRPTIPRTVGGEQAQSKAVQRHPEALRYRAMARAASVDLDLAENRVAPKLDLKGEISRDFGSGNEDERTTLAPPVVKAGVVFELPLALRKERGKRDMARAKLSSVRAKAQLVQDKIRMRVQDAASALRRAIERSEQASKAADVAARLAEGERRRFDMGATTLIWVTMREKTAADAQLDAIQALVDAQFAWAGYRIALVERPASQ